MAENSADIAKRILLGCVAEGMTIDAACASAGKSMKTYEYYRRTDKIFADKIDRTRLGLKDKQFQGGDVHDIDFVEFRQRFLHSRTFDHQRNIVDVIEGREPRWLHPAMKFEKGVANNRILVNIPPNHAKSMTITVDYVTWQVARNPNFRVLIVSQTQRLAADFLYAIKQRLTHPMYADLQSAYAAGVGFNSKTASWQATRVTFGDELRESSEKDPNIEAVGIGGQIYGKRADMIIVDDAVTMSNANDFERQIKWLTQDVRSRLNPTGKLIILESPYIWFGVIAYIIVFLLGITTPNSIKKMLGKNWKKLHRFIYLAGIVGVIHYFWQLKGNLAEPLLYTLILFFLLGFRALVEFTRRRLSNMMMPKRME